MRMPLEILVLMSLHSDQQRYNAALILYDASMLALYVSILQAQVVNIVILIAALFANPGYRPQLGVRNIYNPGFFAKAMQMKKPVAEGGKPEQFRGYFRMQPETFDWFAERLWQRTAPEPEPASTEEREGGKKRGRPKGTRDKTVFTKRLLMTLWFLGTGCTYKTLSAQFGCDVDYRTLLVDEIAAMADVFVQWPRGDDAIAVANEFSRLRSRNSYQYAGFDRCLGAIDGSFIKVLRPMASVWNAQVYNTYKKYYAITLLAVALPDHQITYAHVGTPGSRADVWILKSSSLYRNTCAFIPHGFYLLGDSGFQLLVWLMIGFANATLAGARGARQKLMNMFNAAQQSARVVVENTFGILKGRFRILHYGIHTDLVHAKPITTACIVLHNVAIVRQDLWPTQDQIGDKDLDWFRAQTSPDWLEDIEPTPLRDPDELGVRQQSKAAENKREDVLRAIGPPGGLADDVLRLMPPPTAPPAP